MYNNYKKAKNNSDPRDYDGRGESQGSNEQDIKGMEDGSIKYRWKIKGDTYILESRHHIVFKKFL